MIEGSKIPNMNLDRDMPIHSPEDEMKTAVLPPELLPYVSLERLSANAQNYPEMAMELTEIQKERVEKINDVLAQVPLIHATSNEQIANGLSGISPSDDLPVGHHGYSLESDRSLGLTKCVFFNWGMAQKGFGRFIAQFSPDLLDRENTFVTPMDIGQIEFADDRPFEEFEPERRDRVDQHYFKYMVTGKTWKDIIARRILKTAESGQSFFPLSSSYSLGEIKHYGTVSVQDYIGSFPVADLRAHYRFLYEHGFSFTNMELDRGIMQNGGKRTSVDPTYEDCGINYEEASNFWKRTLEIE